MIDLDFSLPENQCLGDGVWDLTGIEHEEYYLGDVTKEKWEKWTEKYPDAVYSAPYETEYCFFLSRQPQKVDKSNVQGQNNYGSACVISNCPSKILIAAEND